MFLPSGSKIVLRLSLFNLVNFSVFVSNILLAIFSNSVLNFSFSFSISCFWVSSFSLKELFSANAVASLVLSSLNEFVINFNSFLIDLISSFFSLIVWFAASKSDFKVALSPISDVSVVFFSFMVLFNSSICFNSSPFFSCKFDISWELEAL